MKNLIFLYILFSCSSNKGFLINNYQPKDKRIGETILVNQKESNNSSALNIKFVLKENIELMEKCVEDSSDQVNIALRFTFDQRGKVLESSVEKLNDKEQRKCLNKILSAISFQQLNSLGNTTVYQSITLNY